MAAATIPETAHTNPWGITLSRPAFDLFVGPDASPGARTWEQLIGDLLALRALPADWDGQGAEAPAPAVVDGNRHSHHLRHHRAGARPRADNLPPLRALHGEHLLKEARVNKGTLLRRT